MSSTAGLSNSPGPGQLSDDASEQLRAQHNNLQDFLRTTGDVLDMSRSKDKHAPVDDDSEHSHTKRRTKGEKVLKHRRSDETKSKQRRGSVSSESSSSASDRGRSRKQRGGKSSTAHRSSRRHREESSDSQQSHAEHRLRQSLREDERRVRSKRHEKERHNYDADKRVSRATGDSRRDEDDARGRDRHKSSSRRRNRTPNMEADKAQSQKSKAREDARVQSVPLFNASQTTTPNGTASLFGPSESQAPSIVIDTRSKHRPVVSPGIASKTRTAFASEVQVANIAGSDFLTSDKKGSNIVGMRKEALRFADGPRQTDLRKAEERKLEERVAVRPGAAVIDDTAVPAEATPSASVKVIEEPQRQQELEFGDSRPTSPHQHRRRSFKTRTLDVDCGACDIFCGCMDILCGCFGLMCDCLRACGD